MGLKVCVLCPVRRCAYTAKIRGCFDKSTTYCPIHRLRCSYMGHKWRPPKKNKLLKLKRKKIL